MAFDNFRMPQPRFYSHQDLYPRKWDPRCSPDFPLGNFWPVYLGNFWCEKYSEHATKVQEYFASKGLLVRMVFGRKETDDPFRKYQHNVHLYDFLVYFVREEDAQDAIDCCHREMYYGHRLNVFPGRVPLYFDLTKSVKHQTTGLLREVTGQAFETYIQKKCPARMACVVQKNKRTLLVEYVSTKDRDRAIVHCRICIPMAVATTRKKQRYIEEDVQQEICKRFQKDPSFGSTVPRDIILANLFNGIRYNCYTWRFNTRLVMPRGIYAFGFKPYKFKYHKTLFEYALKHFGVKCPCLRHVRIYARMEKDKANRAIKAAQPPAKKKLRNEVAANNAPPNESNIQSANVAVQAPRDNRSVPLEPANFYDDSHDVDGNLGYVF